VRLVREDVISHQAQRETNQPAGLRRSAPFPADCQAVFQSIAKNCVNLNWDHRKAAITADPEAVHSMRIELTRLRAAVLFFSMTDDEAWPRINKELRWLNLALGKARDQAVTANYTRRKRYRRWAKGSRPAMLRVQRKVDHRLTKKLGSDRCIRLTTTVTHWIANGPWLQTGQSIRSENVDAYAKARVQTWREAISREGRDIRLPPAAAALCSLRGGPRI